MSLTDLDALTPWHQAGASYLTDDEWEQVFRHIQRGVTVKDIYRVYASKKGYTTLYGFYRAVQHRRAKHGAKALKATRQQKKEPGA